MSAIGDVDLRDWDCPKAYHALKVAHETASKGESMPVHIFQELFNFIATMEEAQRRQERQTAKLFLPKETK